MTEDITNKLINHQSIPLTDLIIWNFKNIQIDDLSYVERHGFGPDFNSTQGRPTTTKRKWVRMSAILKVHPFYMYW